MSLRWEEWDETKKKRYLAYLEELVAKAGHWQCGCSDWRWIKDTEACPSCGFNPDEDY